VAVRTITDLCEKGAGKSEAVQRAADQLSVSAQKVNAPVRLIDQLPRLATRSTMTASRCWIVSIKAGRLSPSCSAASLISAGWPIGYPNRISLPDTPTGT